MLSDDPEERRRTTTAGGAVAVELDESAASAPSSGWAGFVYRILDENRISQFARLLREPRPGLKRGELDALGDSLASSLRSLAAPVN
jgi:hypothetical protein